ncbi:hypothetical protein ACSSWA_13695 [Melioribacter sp. Ez-97]|uniref:hypothetical protein n=1 Tax=Melioribacter sp. Ez-97 TaxID=3423434 RepID=UPI003EDA7558
MKLNIRYFLALFFISTVSLFSQDDDSKNRIQLFDLNTIAERNLNCALIMENTDAGKKYLEVKPIENNAGLVIWEKGDFPDWAKARYLVIEILGGNDYGGTINIEFYKEAGKSAAEKIILQSGEVKLKDKNAPWFSSLMGILPRLRTKIVFPLSYLDAQTLFVERFPRQLKGTINGNRFYPDDITKVVLRFGPCFEPYFKPVYNLFSVYLSDEKPEPCLPLNKPVIDKFGQWTLKDWKGKINNEKELIRKQNELKNDLKEVNLPESWSKYGGWKEKKFKATGFFRTQHDGKRWWLVDPEGYAFLSVGVDCIRKTSAGPVEGIEDLFEWLPGEDDPEASALFNNRDGKKYMDFYVSNLIRVFGKDWEKEWESVTAGLLKKFRFNTIGNWSDIEYAKKIKIPYVLPLRNFPSTDILLYRDFPDVFSKEYEVNSEEFARQLADYKNDPYLIGYFLRNEPHWAFGYHNLAFEMFAVNQQSATKEEFVKWIKEKYRSDISAFNKYWNLNLKNFSELKEMTFKDYPSETADKDFYLFSEIMVKKYIDVPCDAVEKIDSNHLNLGMRYAWISSDLLYKAGERFDVFSINGYGLTPPPTSEIAERSGKPVMIGEFHHGAVDRGLPATGIVGVLSQRNRADAYRNYVEQGFARPELVGIHYFQWIDQPFYGRFDGENYNIGVVDITNNPYEELTGAMTETNRQIYEIGDGAIKPFKKDIVKIPPIHY